MKLGLGIYLGSRRASGGLSSAIIAKLAGWWYSLPFTTEIVNKIGDQDRLALGGEVFTGRAHAYDGVDQYAYVADNGALDIAEATTDFCFGGWITTGSDITTLQYTLGKIVHATLDGRYGIFITGGNLYLFCNSSGGYVQVVDNITLTINTEYFVEVRFDLTVKKIYLYINKVLQNSGGTSFTGTFGTLANQFEFYLAAGNNSAGTGAIYYTECQLRDIRIYHKDVSSSANQTAWMNGERLGDELAWWMCEDTDLYNTFDASGNGYHLTNANHDTTSFVEGNWQSIYNKYGYEEHVTYGAIPLDMSSVVNSIPQLTLSGAAATFKGQAKYNAQSVEASCFVGDGVAYWKGQENIAIGGVAEIEFYYGGITVVEDSSIMSGSTGSLMFIRIGSGGATLSVGGTNGLAQAANFNIPSVYDGDIHKFNLSVNTPSVRLYIDDVEIASNSNSWLSDTIIGSSTYDIYVGTRLTPNDFYITSAKLFGFSFTSPEITFNTPMCEGEGLTAHDVSGNGNHLTMINGDESNWGLQDEYHYLRDYGVGFVGQFNGVDDEITLNSQIVIDRSKLTTVSFSARRNSTSAVSYIIGGDSNIYGNIFFDAIGKILYETNTNADVAFASLLVDDTNWHDYEITVNNSMVSIKQDGIDLDLGVSNVITDDLNLDYIGSTGTANYLDGNIANMKIVENGITILDLVITGRSTTETDLSGNGNDGTWSGTGDHSATIPALLDKSATAIGTTLQYPQRGNNAIPETYIKFPENVKELFDADQRERYELDYDSDFSNNVGWTVVWGTAPGDGTIEAIGNELLLTVTVPPSSGASLRPYIGGSRLVSGDEYTVVVSGTGIIAGIYYGTYEGIAPIDLNNNDFTFTFTASTTTLNLYFDGQTYPTFKVSKIQLYKKTQQTGNNQTIASIADYSATVAGTILITKVAHRLTTADEVVISGTTSYDGTHSVTVVDPDTFYITETFVADEAGTFALVIDGRFYEPDGTPVAVKTDDLPEQRYGVWYMDKTDGNWKNGILVDGDITYEEHLSLTKYTNNN